LEARLARCIRDLSPIHFQYFCGLFLEEQGYTVQNGSYCTGKRDKGRDFWGTKGIVSFEAHCKGCNSSSDTRTSFFAALLEAGRHHQENQVAPPRRIILFGQQPVYKLSSDNSELDCDETKDWIKKNIEKLQDKYSCYSSHTPEVQIYHPAAMAARIANEKYYFNHAIRFLNEIGSQMEQHPEDRLFDDDYEEESSEIESQIAALEKDITGLRSLIPAMVESSFDLALDRIVSLIGGNFFLAGRLSETLTTNPPDHPLFREAVELYCQVVQEKEVPSGRLCSFINAVVDREKHSDSLPCRGFRLCLTRILRSLFYCELDVTADARFFSVLASLFDCSPYWAKLAVDTHYRTLISTIQMRKELAETLKTRTLQYRADYHDVPLSKVYDWISDPIAVSSSTTRSRILEEACEIAPAIRDTLDLKWLLVGLSRVLSLCGSEENETYTHSDIDDFTEKVLKGLPRELFESTPYVPYLLLKAQLLNLNRRPTLDGLLDFERQLGHQKQRVYYRQLREIQINYAGCLRSFLRAVFEGHEDAPWDKLSLLGGHALFRLRDDREPPDPASSRVFAFSGVEHLGIQPPPPERKPAHVMQWLDRYASECFDKYFKSSLKQNHFQAILLKPARQVDAVRIAIHAILVNRLEKLANEGFPLTPRGAANSLRVFEVPASSKNVHLFPPLLELATKAPDYEVRRASRAVWHILYLLDRYGREKVDIGIIDGLLATAMERTRPGIPGTLPESWAYAGAILIKVSDSLERRFAESLAGELIELHGSPTYKSGGTAQMPAVLGTEELSIFKEWATKGSLLAAALVEDCRNPEIWNLLGTSQLDFYPKEDKPETALKNAVEFYRVALWLARESRQVYNPKYGFHYIERIAQLYLKQDTVPSTTDLQEWHRILSSRSAELFTYNKDRSRQLFLLLDRKWGLFSHDTIEGWIRPILRVRWIRELIRGDNDLQKLRDFA